MTTTSGEIFLEYAVGEPGIHPGMRPRRRYPWLLAALSGALLALAFPGSGDQGWLAFVALVPLLAAIEEANWRSAGVLGLLSGAVFWLATIPWVAPTMVRHGGVPWPLAALTLAALAGYLALYTGAFCALLTRNRLSSSAGYVVVAASLWVALELLRTYLLTGFPWNLLGYSQHANLPLIQIASATGVYGVSFVVVAVNAALAGAFRAGTRWTEASVGLGVAAATVAVAVGTGWLVVPQRTPPSIPVAIVQGNVEQGVKWDPAFQGETLATYGDLTREAARRGAQLVVWPETAVPLFRRDDPKWKDVEGVAREAGVHLVVGAPDWRAGRPRNSAVTLGPDGRVLGRYDKRHLVPFGEYVPLERVLFFVDVLAGGAIGAFAPGAEASVVATPAGRVAVVICYEAIFPAEVRQFIGNGADVLVNITNDAWFGESAAPVQHLVMAKFRAVENRVYLVRAANTGISAIVAPDGRVTAASGLFTRWVLMGAIGPRPGGSIYTRHGDVFAWATVGVAALALWPLSLSGSRTRLAWPKRRAGAVQSRDERRPLLAALLGAVGAAAGAAWLGRPQPADGRGYREVARWRLQAGGQGRFIAVAPEPTTAELRALGDRLRAELAGAADGVVMIFDDVDAAREVRQGSRTIGEERFQAALRHQRAMYIKQAGRGEDRFVIYDSYPMPREVMDYASRPAEREAGPADRR